MSGEQGNITPETMSGELMSLVARRLTSRGARITYPGSPGGRRMRVAELGGMEPFDLSIYDDGDVQFHGYISKRKPDPRKAADVATVLLTGRTGPFEYLGDGHGKGGISFKGIVGLELRARGLSAELKTFEDAQYLNAEAWVRVTNPQDGSDSEIFLGDDAEITWVRDYQAEYSAEKWEPEFPPQLERKDEIADDIANRIASAADLLCPA